MFVPLSPMQFLDRATRLYGEKVGVVDGQARFTYRTFTERVNRLSHALSHLGVRRGVRVAFLSRNTHELLEAYFGVVQIGAILLPLNIRLTADDLTFILNDAGASILVVDDDLEELAERIVPAVPTLAHVLLLGDTPGKWVSYEAVIGEQPSARPEEPVPDEQDVAALFYTSGTTGRPKGVMLTHRNLWMNAISVIIGLQLQDTDVQLHTIPLFHVNGWGAPHAVTAVGGRHVILRQFDPERVARLIQEERVTLFFAVPTMITALMNFPGLDRYDLSSLRRVLVGGAPAAPSMVREATRRLGCLVTAAYGLSETSPFLTIASLKSTMLDTEPEERWRRLAMTGMEVVGVHLRVVNERGEDVRPDGREMGEIVVRGNCVMAGYWRRPEETAQVLREGWLWTGDMATIDAEGFIQIKDRRKDIIISGGENISSIEIESVLHEHPSVLECAVIAVPEEYWGEVPKAIVVCRSGSSISAEEVLTFLRERLAHFKVPRSVEFRDALPKTGTGKIDKIALREPYWRGLERQVH